MKYSTLPGPASWRPAAGAMKPSGDCGTARGIRSLAVLFVRELLPVAVGGHIKSPSLTTVADSPVTLCVSTSCASKTRYSQAAWSVVAGPSSAVKSTVNPFSFRPGEA